MSPERVSALTIEVETSTPNYPMVRLLIDGVEKLATEGEERNDAEGLLDSGALRPQEPPRRIAFYGCGCGEFGCSNIAGLVVREGDRVAWRDFRTLTGAYGGPLPDEDDGPDPAVVRGVWDDGYSASGLPIADVVFDADEYLAEVARAETDRSWETRARRVCRLARGRLGSWTVWPTDEGERICLSRDFYGTEIALQLPGGPDGVVVDALAHALDRPDVGEALAAARWSPGVDRPAHDRRARRAADVLSEAWSQRIGPPRRG